MIPVRNDFRVFAIEDTSIQLTWGTTGVGELQLWFDGRHQSVPLRGGPGCVDIDDLRPGQEVRIRYEATAIETTRGELVCRTLEPPPGDELDRFATLTDVHVARRTFGVHRQFWDPPGGPPHTVTCSHAAVDELVRWGARHLFVKGDLIETSTPYHWAAAERLLANLVDRDGGELGVDATPGNHEVNRHGTIDPFIAAERAGIRLHRDQHVVDRPGVRVVIMNSSVPGLHRGEWMRHAPEVADAVRGRPSLVITHHQPHGWPVQTYFPPGIEWSEARTFARQIMAANRAVMGTSGHTHRHRRHDICGMPWTETGSPKDYPGTWTGYVVYEGGIRQIVRRVTEPSSVAWLDRSGGAVNGLWGRWSPGRLRDRCFTWRWPSR